MNQDSKVAVCSRSFSNHALLRQELLSRFTQVKFNDSGKSLIGRELVDFLRGSDRAIIALESIDSVLLKELPELKVIGKFGVGLDKLDLKAMDDHGVQMGWTAGVNAPAVAELTLALALNIVRNIPKSNQVLRNGEWHQVSGQQLSSMTYGVLGCGHVGKALVKLLRPFGAKILACDVVDISDFCKENDVESVSFSELVKRADVLSIHIPKNKKTAGLLSREVLKSLKVGSYLVNTARGGLVDEAAVVDLLDSGHLSAAAFDVFEQEPPLIRKLVDHPKVYGTTHIGGSSQEAVLAMGRAAITGLEHFQRATAYEQI